jgi:hypothetical protein
MDCPAQDSQGRKIPFFLPGGSVFLSCSYLQLIGRVPLVVDESNRAVLCQWIVESDVHLIQKRRH